MVLHILTVATHYDGYLDSLIYTVPSLVVLGAGKPWNGYITKIKYIYEKLFEYDDNDIVIFCDAYDVLAHKNRCENAIEIERMFKELNVDILLSAHDYARHNFFVHYYVKRAFVCLRAYEPEILLSCNPGLYIAYCGPLKSLLGDLLALGQKTHENDDERLLNMVLNNYTEPLEKCPFRLRYFAASGSTFTIGADIDEQFFHNHLPLDTALLSLINGTYEPPDNIFESKHSLFYHFIGNQNLDTLCRSARIPHRQTKKQYTNFMKARHYTKFFKFELLLLSCSCVALLFVFIMHKQQKHPKNRQ